MRDAWHRLILAQAVNRFGDGFFSIGVSWIIYTHTHSVLPLGFLWAGYLLLVGGLQSALSPLVDALDRRAVLVVLNLLCAVIVVTPVVLGAFGLYRVFELYPAFVLLGIVAIPQQSAVSAIVPALVPEDHLVAANARLQGVMESMYLLGPAVAGFALAAFGALSGLAIDGATFLIAAVLLMTLPPVRAEGHDPGQLYRHALLEGARTIWDDRRLRLLAALAILVQFTDVAFIVLSVPLVRTVLQGTTRGVGLLEASLSGGYILGAWLIGRFASRIRRESRWALVVVFCLATAGIAVVPRLAWALFTQVVGGVADSIFQVEWEATFQGAVEDRQRGRVFMWQAGAQRTAGGFGAIVAGLVAFGLGIPAAFATLGLLGAVLSAWVLATLRRLPDGLIFTRETAPPSRS